MIVGAGDSNTLIGGTAEGAGNVISGNGWNGVAFSSQTSNSVVEGNFIGTDASGTVALGNGLDGVRLFDGARMNRIGGDTAAAGNVIAFNGGNGVTVTATNTFGNTIRANSIHSNGGIGIDLGNDGATLNDDGDADGGPNLLQNYPTSTEATENTLETYVTGSFDGAANVSLTIDF